MVAGNKLRLDVEISGEPAPTVCWMRGDKVRTGRDGGLRTVTPPPPPSRLWSQVVSEAEGRVRVETRKTLSSFVIEGAMKEDEGTYSIAVTNPAGEDKAELFVKIVGRWRVLTRSDSLCV